MYYIFLQGGAKILYGEASPLLGMGLVGTPFPHQT